MPSEHDAEQDHSSRGAEETSDTPDLPDPTPVAREESVEVREVAPIALGLRHARHGTSRVEAAPGIDRAQEAVSPV